MVRKKTTTSDDAVAVELAGRGGGSSVTFVNHGEDENATQDHKERSAQPDYKGTCDDTGRT